MVLVTYIVGASSVCAAERKTRRLFRLEQRLKHKKEALLSQINPFSPEHLEEWMQQRETRDAPSRTSQKHFRGMLRAPSQPKMIPRSQRTFEHDPGSISGSNDTRTTDEEAEEEEEEQEQHINLQLHNNRSTASSAGREWQLDQKYLTLVRKVAAGSAGIVWQAYYKRDLVAAKQL